MSGPPPSDTVSEQPARPDASMTLLREVMERPLDPGYALAAARTGPQTRRRVLVTGLLAVLAGYVLSVAVVEARLPQPDASRATNRLRVEVEKRSESLASLERANAALRADISAAQKQALASSGSSDLLDQAAQLGLVTGELPVIGPGLRFSVNDAPGSRPDSGLGADPRSDPDLGVVIDRDLQIIVNGLWQSGAEAIAVNGQRLTSLSAIRSAGEAILVDFRPLVPPYIVDAIGDPSRLQAAFAASSAGAYVQSMRDNSGIAVGVAPREELVVPAAAQLILRSARTVTSPSAQPRTQSSAAAAPAASAAPPVEEVP